MMESAGMKLVEAEARGLALLFLPDCRPDAAHVCDLLGRVQGVAVGHRPVPDRGWIELLSRGLAFDLSSLAPGAAALLPSAVKAEGLEPVLLSAGRHLEGGAHLLPVLRAHLALGLALSALPGVQALVWAPAGAVIPVDAFVRIMTFWLEGGPFPALTLVTLARDEDGAVLTKGLTFLIGQELRIEAAPGEAVQRLRALAIVLIDHLVRKQAGETVPRRIKGPDEVFWALEPVPDQKLLLARRTG